MPGRKYSAANEYRYGFNGKENDKDISDGAQDYGMRIYDSRLGKFLSVDPLSKSYPHYTPYSFAGNKPIWCIDMDGCEDSTATNSSLGNAGWFTDFIHWAENPSMAPFERDGAIADLNDNFNPIGIAYNYGTKIIYGKDRFARPLDERGRLGAVNDLGTEVVLCIAATKFFKLALAPKNAFSVLEETMTKQEVASQGIKPKPTSNIAEQNRGQGVELEKATKNAAAAKYESSVQGAASDVKTRKNIVPTLKYDNPNINGKNFIKFDGFSGPLQFIDRKLNVTGFPKSIDQVQRAAAALSQNPGSTLTYEVPANKFNAMVTLLRKAGQALNPNISVKIVSNQ